MKKKAFLLLSCCLTGLLAARAESCLVLQLRDGQSFSYVLNDKPVMTFAEGTLTMKSADAEATFGLADIENFHFADKENSIRKVDDVNHQFSYLDGVISVEGIQEQVVLTNAAGQLLHSTRSGQPFTFDLKGQPQGTYLMRIGHQSVKLYHK